MEYVNSREAKRILSIKSSTTMRTYEKLGKLNPTRIFGSNRLRYKVTELQKILKGC